jgi:hypothetical protein
MSKRSRWRPRPSLAISVLAVFVALAVVVAIPLASASSSSSPFAVLEDCRTRGVLVPGVEKQVRARVPAQFELVRDPLGRPLLSVVGARCERFTVNDTTRPTTVAVFAAIIESPDGAGCLSRWSVLGVLKPDLLPICNFYAPFYALDNRAAVKAYRSFVPDAPVYFVRNLVFDQEDLDLARLGAPFRFRAGRGTPSPFKLDGIVREGAVEGPATLSSWVTGSSGTAIFREEIADLALGQMDATLRVAPGSEMAELLGTETPKPIAGYASRYHHNELFLAPGAPKRTTPVCKGRRATIVGSGSIRGTAADDVIVGSDGPDRIDGGGGNDRICAGRGRDRARGGPGRDLLFGGLGRDRLSGGAGRDRLHGGAGRDRLAGGPGLDKLVGGAGKDTERQ